MKELEDYIRFLYGDDLNNPANVSEEAITYLEDGWRTFSKLLGEVPSVIANRKDEIIKNWQSWHDMSPDVLRKRIALGKKWLEQHENDTEKQDEYMKAHSLYMDLVDLARRKGVSEESCWDTAQVFEKVFGDEIEEVKD